jgi:hypothetical protein
MGAPVAATSPSAAPSAQAVDVEVTARDLSFTPTELDIPAQRSASFGETRPRA